MISDREWKQCVHAQKKIIEDQHRVFSLMATIAGKIDGHKTAGRTVFEELSKALELSQTTKGQIFAFFRKRPTHVVTTEEIDVAMHGIAHNALRARLSDLVDDGFVARVGRGQYRLATSDDGQRARSDTSAIDPNSIRGRMLALVDAHPGRLFTTAEITAALKCKPNATRQAAFKLASQGCVIVPKYGHYRSVNEPD